MFEKVVDPLQAEGFHGPSHIAEPTALEHPCEDIGSIPFQVELLCVHIPKEPLYVLGNPHYQTISRPGSERQLSAPAGPIR